MQTNGECRALGVCGIALLVGDVGMSGTLRPVSAAPVPGDVVIQTAAVQDDDVRRSCDLAITRRARAPADVLKAIEVSNIVNL